MSLEATIAELRDLTSRWRSSIASANAAKQAMLQKEVRYTMRTAVSSRTQELEQVYLDMQAAEAAKGAGGGERIPMLKARRDQLLAELEALQAEELTLIREFSNPPRVVTRKESVMLLETEERSSKRFRRDETEDQKMKALLLAASVRPDVQEKFLGTLGLRAEVIAQGVKPLPENMQERFLQSIPTERSVMRMMSRGGTMTSANNFAALRFCVEQDYSYCVTNLLTSKVTDDFFTRKDGDVFVWKQFVVDHLLSSEQFKRGLHALSLVLRDPRAASWVPTEQILHDFGRMSGIAAVYRTSKSQTVFYQMFKDLVKRRPTPLTPDFFVLVLADPRERVFVQEMLIVALQDLRFDTHGLVLHMMENLEDTVLRFVLLEPNVPRDDRSIVTQEMLTILDDEYLYDESASKCLAIVLSDPRTTVTDADTLMQSFWGNGMEETGRVLYAYMKRNGRLAELRLTAIQNAVLNPATFAGLVRSGKF